MTTIVFTLYVFKERRWSPLKEKMAHKLEAKRKDKQGQHPPNYAVILKNVQVGTVGQNKQDWSNQQLEYYAI